MERLKKTKLISITFVAVALSLGSGCSHPKPTDSSQQQDAANVPPPDAGTDAVPQAAVEDRSGQSSADLPPPPSPDNAQAAAATPPTAAPDAPPAPIADNSAPPAAPPAPAAVDQNPTDQSQAQAAPPAPAADQASNDSQSGSSAPMPAPAVADDSGNYTVRAGDTLMKIAFDNYGDLYKWKEIYDANKDHIKDPNAIPPGTVLKIQKADTPVAVERNGDQYLIKSGDTLGTISKDVYGTSNKWKKLWENNKQLIHDPNKIYAGFYLFYTLDQKERLGFNERHGVQGENPTSVASTPDDQERAPASAPEPAALPPPSQAAPQAANTAAANSAAGNEARNPASINPGVAPPTINANDLTNGIAPPPQQMLNVAPPAQHSADLNEVIQKAQLEENSQAAAAGAGP